MMGRCAIKASEHVLLLLDCAENVLGGRLVKTSIVQVPYS